MPGTFGDANTARLDALMKACEAPPEEPEDSAEAATAPKPAPSWSTSPASATPAV